MMPERPESSRPPEQDEPAAEPEGAEEAYSEDEEAAVAARLEDLGYI